ncbi:GntR family transcriptional regulator [Xylophilus sp. Kf1]|nr:GntR family transcriptional regulator [Xylophilus sp. Kf1]
MTGPLPSGANAASRSRPEHCARSPEMVAADLPGPASGPLFQQVVERLRHEIAQGVHPVGQNLPTEAELSARFGLSRHTIRDALRELRLAGLVTSRRGSGTTVARQGGGQYYLHENGSLEDILQYVTSTRWDYTTQVETIDAEQADLLESAPGQRWLRLEGCRFSGSDPRPVYWTQAYLHADFAAAAEVPDRRATPLYQRMEERYGVSIGGVEQVIRGRAVPSAVGALLGLPPATTVIEMVRSYRLTDGRLVELSTNLHPIDGFSLAMKLCRRGR